MNIPRKIVNAAYHELRLLSEDEGCDHSVNICWCETFEVLHQLEEALELPWETRLPQTASRRLDQPAPLAPPTCEYCGSTEHFDAEECNYGAPVNG